MAASLILDGRTCTFDENRPVDISIPLRFNGPQPNSYGVEPATSQPCVSGDLVGDTRQGGSCNFEQYTLIPHCNGTHTECVGHITHERIAITDCLRDTFAFTALISIEPTVSHNGDMVITRRILENRFSEFQWPHDPGPRKFTGLVVRTLPNDDTKIARQYLNDIPPYFTSDAMELILELGVRHLLVDLPSIDRLHDEGRLINHRIFWNVASGSYETNDQTRIHNTITELIYVPNEVIDGLYLLNLQIAAFSSDASPSRPILFRVR